MKLNVLQKRWWRDEMDMMKNNKREQLIMKIFKLVQAGTQFTLQDMENKKCKTDEYKRGIYFLFNQEDVCIYVGKVGNGTYTSLYHRMV